MEIGDKTMMWLMNIGYDHHEKEIETPQERWKRNEVNGHKMPVSHYLNDCGGERQKKKKSRIYHEDYQH